jgi:hypothetical protein
MRVWGYDAGRTSFLLLDLWPGDYNLTRAKQVQYDELEKEAIVSLDSMGASANDVLDVWKKPVLLRVTWERLEREVVRLHTTGTPNSMDYFVTSIFGSEDPKKIAGTSVVFLALGDTLLLGHADLFLNDNDRFATPAMLTYREALDSAQRMRDTKLEEIAASRLYAASLVTASHARRDRSRDVGSLANDQLTMLLQKYSPSTLEAELTGKRLFLVVRSLVEGAMFGPDPGRDVRYALGLLERHGSVGKPFLENEVVFIRLLALSNRRSDARARAEKLLPQVQAAVREMKTRLQSLAKNEWTNRDMASVDLRRMASIEAAVSEALADTSP